MAVVQLAVTGLMAPAGSAAGSTGSSGLPSWAGLVVLVVIVAVAVVVALRGRGGPWRRRAPHEDEATFRRNVQNLDGSGGL